MTAPIISAHKLAKCYRLGVKAQQHETLIHSFYHFLKAPLKSYRQLYNLTHFDTDDESVLWALKDVSFDLNKGDLLGIIGKNGSGKSTLLKILSRITHPTRGNAHIRGRVASLLEVGTGFHPDLTGRENIYLNGTILGMTKKEIDKKFDEIVAFAEIDNFIDTPVKRYSSGMGVRLAFAVAAHLEPEILIIDEVLAVGDVTFQKKCLGKMKDISQNQGRTVLFVSHNMAAVRNLCNKALLLKKGVIVEEGTPDGVIAHYLATVTNERKATIALPPNPITKKVQATALHCQDASGRPHVEFKIGEPWQVIIEFELKQDYEHVIASVGLVHIESLPLYTIWSEAQDLKKGRYKVVFTIDIPLSAMELCFAVGITSSERTLYFHTNLGNVSISEIALGKQPVRSKDSGLLLGLDRPVIECV